ncbi:MAG: cytochrome c biogenesis protein CcsA [Deltaproteobacteria bacterium]|nr:MAG: cytochrome c biogenesis protein CcsA [Deltaproteobacteria bacterium]
MSISFLLTTHLIFMTVAFMIFSINFLVGLTYLIEERRLKQRKPPLNFRWLPSLRGLDSFHYNSLLIGFILLTCGIVVGTLLSKKIMNAYLTDDPRQIASLVIWSIYAFFLKARLQSGLKGRRGMILSALGFLGVVLAFIAIRHHV